VELRYEGETRSAQLHSSSPGGEAWLSSLQQALSSI